MIKNIFIIFILFLLLNSCSKPGCSAYKTVNRPKLSSYQIEFLKVKNSDREFKVTMIDEFGFVIKKKNATGSYEFNISTIGLVGTEDCNQIDAEHGSLILRLQNQDGFNTSQYISISNQDVTDESTIGPDFEIKHDEKLDSLIVNGKTYKNVYKIIDTSIGLAYSKTFYFVKGEGYIRLNYKNTFLELIP